MRTAKNQVVESGKFLFISILVIGSLWGLLEASVGVGLRGSCARFLTGSMLTGTSLLFFACAYMLTGRLVLVIVLPVIAGLFRLYAGLLLGQAVMSGAVANPIYAFFVEALAFCAVIYLMKQSHVRSLPGAGIAGMTAAVLSANLFLPVKVFTGIPACVVPGTDFPLCIWGLPTAMVVAAGATPLGFRVGSWIRQRMEAPGHVLEPVLGGAGIVVSAACLLAVTLLHVR